MNGKGISKLLAGLICLSIILILPACSKQSSNDTTAQSTNPTTTSLGETKITLTDDMNRQITFEKSPQHAVVVSRYNLELLRACGLIDHVAGVDDSVIENSVYWPEFNKDESVGNQDELNYESIAALEPDVLILPSNLYTDKIESAMSAFNIPVVVITGYSTDFIKQIDIIDKLFGATSESEALRSFYNDTSAKISSIVSSIPEADRKKVCWESIKDYSVALASNDWSKMIVNAGGINVFGNPSFTESTVDGEAMITANPDVIFKMIAATGTELSGYTPPTQAEYKTAADAYIPRAGFNKITAVQNGDLYFVTSFSMGGMGKLVGTAFAAKWLYPDQFADFDANAVFERWMTEFQHMDSVSGHSYRTGDYEN